MRGEQARQQAQAEGLTLLRADNKAGYFGVQLNKPGQPKPYMAQVSRGGKLVNLGSFATAEEAALCIARSPEGKEAAKKAAAALFAAAFPSGVRATHSAASSAVAKLPRCTSLPPRHTFAL